MMVMGVAAVSDPRALEETKARIVSLARHAVVVGMPALIRPYISSSLTSSCLRPCKNQV